MDASMLYVITVLVSCIAFFVIDIFLTNRKHTKKLSEIITTLAVKDKDCAKTHEIVNKEINSIKETVDNKIIEFKEHVSERFEETLALVNNHKH